FSPFESFLRPRHHHAFPTRRSSDLTGFVCGDIAVSVFGFPVSVAGFVLPCPGRFSLIAVFSAFLLQTLLLGTGYLVVAAIAALSIAAARSRFRACGVLLRTWGWSLWKNCLLHGNLLPL